MLFALDRVAGDREYRDELRFRCITDHFFLGQMLGKGFDKLDRVVHAKMAGLYVKKKPGLSIEEQDTVKNMIDLEPREVYKTTMGHLDSIQWILVDPDMTILNEGATQPLAKAISNVQSAAFVKPKGRQPTVFQSLFPEYVVEKAGDGWYMAPCRTYSQVDMTIDTTSVQTSQSGFHPWVFNADDAVDTTNSGIKARDEIRAAVISNHNTNINTKRRGGYFHARGTRYHPFELWGALLKQAELDPEHWRTVVQPVMRLNNGKRLLPGGFPDREAVTILYPFVSYEELRSKYEADYEVFMCFPAGSPVLMSDWSERAIEQLRVGDEVIGFGNKLERATVKAVHTKVGRVVRAITNTGRIILTTPDHEFLKPATANRRVGTEYGHLELNGGVVSVYCPSDTPFEDQQRKLDWLGGLLDGEGTMNTQGVRLYQSEDNPEVCTAIRETLNALEIPFDERRDSRRGVKQFLLHGGRSLRVRLAMQCQMARRKRVIESLWEAPSIMETNGRRGGSSEEFVVSIEDIGEHQVYDITTTTSNYVCQGFAVHNCQQMNDPQGGGLQIITEELYDSCLVDERKMPLIGEVLVFWRPAYGGKDFMGAYAEGCACRKVGDKLYVIDAWRGMYTPSGFAEKVVETLRKHQTGKLTMEDVPGTQYVLHDIQNEAARRNLGLKIELVDFEEEDGKRMQRMKALEPKMIAGRVRISKTSGMGPEMRRQFVHLGMVPENGIIDSVSRLALRIPASVIQNELEAEEIESYRRAKNKGLYEHIYGLGGMNEVEQQEEVMATPMPRRGYPGLPDILGGLDG